MPLRSLGYVASALSVAEGHIEVAQIQFVHPIYASERVNGTPTTKTRAEAEKFRKAARRLIGDSSKRVIFATDTTAPPEVDREKIQKAMEEVPRIETKLTSSGSGRGSPIDYLAAHLSLHDTAVEISPLVCDEPLPEDAEIIISLGAGSERTFYEARMQCRSAGVELSGQVSTSQLFTRHVLPPYLVCRDGEPALGDSFPDRGALNNLAPLSVRRDLQYLEEHIKLSGSGSIT